MSVHAGAAPGESRKKARPLYLELRALGLELRAEEDEEDPMGFRVVVEGAGYVPRDRVEGLVPRLRKHKAGLITVLLFRHDADMHAVRGEGSCG